MFYQDVATTAKKGRQKINFAKEKTSFLEFSDESTVTHKGVSNET